MLFNDIGVLKCTCIRVLYQYFLHPRQIVLPLPKNWDCHPLDAKKRKVKVHPVRLDADSQEYKDVNEKFMRSISENICVTSIQRIQNPSMYRSYATKRQSMDEKNGNHKNEWYLFHGTAYQNVKDINAHGLNRSFCGRNGKCFTYEFKSWWKSIVSYLYSCAKTWKDSSIAYLTRKHSMRSWLTGRAHPFVESLVNASNL